MSASTIASAAARFGLSTYTIRYWEQEGLLPRIGRDDAGRRSFSDEDIAWLRYVVCLRDLGVGVRDIAAYVDAATKPDGRQMQIALLTEHLALMRKQREELDYFIGVAEAKLEVLS